jgi:hypothetical protein
VKVFRSTTEEEQAMNRPHSNRARLGGVLLAALAALALLALPGLASGHDHHHEQAADAGTIESFDNETGVLTIALTNGGTVSGLVSPRTHIFCGMDEGWRGHGGHGLRHRRGAAHLSRDGSIGEENHGRGPDDEGQQEHGEEPGEDTPGHDGTPPGHSEDPGQGADHSARCTTEDLVAGGTVRAAELVLIDGSAFYRLVALPPQAPEGE